MMRKLVTVSLVATLFLPALGAAQTAEREANEAEAEGRQLRLDYPSRDVPIKVSGYIWTDTGRMRRTNAQPGQFDQDVSYMQGRFVLGGNYERTFDGYFALGRVEVAGLVNEFAGGQYAAPHVLDAYVKAGQKRWDVQLGRFLAWEVYYLGQGIELYTAERAGALAGPGLYGLDEARGHMNEPGQAAVHYYPTDWLNFEVAGVYGQEARQNYVGVRPAFDLTVGGLKLTGGYEYLDRTPQVDADKVETTLNGYAMRLQYSFAPAGSPWLRAPAGITFSEEAGKGWIGRVAIVGVEFARANVDSIRIDGLPDAENSFDKTTVGAFFDASLARSTVGLAYHLTDQENDQGEQTKHHQATISYLYRLPIPGLSVKAVYGFARGNIEDVDVGGGSTWDNDMHSVRIRVRYDFL